MKSTVIYKNTSKEDVQVAITDVLNQLTEDKSNYAFRLIRTKSIY